MIPEPTLDLVRLDSIIDSMDKEFLHNPEKMCSVLWLNFPNQVYPIPLAYNVTLPPGGTVILNNNVAVGFVEVLINKVIVNVDIPFVMAYIQGYDNGKIYTQDPGTPSIEIPITEWVPVMQQWTLTLTNTSMLFNCTFHSFSVTYAIEAKLFNYIKNKMHDLGLTIAPEDVLK